MDFGKDAGLGAVCFQEGEKDYLTKDVVIKNASPYEMGYSLITELVSETNHFGVQPFIVTPGTAVVPGNGQQIVTTTVHLRAGESGLLSR